MTILSVLSRTAYWQDGCLILVAWYSTNNSKVLAKSLPKKHTVLTQSRIDRVNLVKLLCFHFPLNFRKNMCWVAELNGSPCLVTRTIEKKYCIPSSSNRTHNRQAYSRCVAAPQRLHKTYYAMKKIYYNSKWNYGTVR